MRKAEVILGIDPGFGRVGWGVIADCGGDWEAINYGCIETATDQSYVARLKTMRDEVSKIIKKYRPTRMAVEDLFFFKNLKTAIKVGQARGVILLAAVDNRIPLDEFTPLQVKQAVTGYGRAEKKQMQIMVQTILKLRNRIQSDDAADALAVAICSGQFLWFNKLTKQNEGRKGKICPSASIDTQRA